MVCNLQRVGSRLSSLILLWAVGTNALAPPPGPPLGTLSFLWATLKGQVVPELVRCRQEYGPVFLVKTGPVTQVWVDGSELSTALFQEEACSGRSELKEPVFGGDFLFLVRDLERARTIRSAQKHLLADRSSSRAVAEAVQGAGLDQILLKAFPVVPVSSSASTSSAIASSAVLQWPSEDISSACFEALLQLYLQGGSSSTSGRNSNVREPSEISKPPLSATELETLLSAVASYRKRGPAPLATKLARALNLPTWSQTILSDADVINSMLATVVERSKAPPELLPLLVSATVGGAEIFPLLLRWAVLRLAVDPTAQARLYADLQQRKIQSGSSSGGSSSSSSSGSSSRSDSTSSGSGSGDGSGTGAVKCFGPLFLTAAAACARDCPVSAAVGPPRKLTRDLTFQGYALPAEAICFAMHPGLRAGAAAASLGDAAPWSDSISGGEPSVWSLDLDSPAGHWLMFGAGPRACPASEQSLNFLAAALAVLVEHFTWELATSDTATTTTTTAKAAAKMSDVFAYSEDGSLLAPALNIPLKFTRRDAG